MIRPIRVRGNRGRADGGRDSRLGPGEQQLVVLAAEKGRLESGGTRLRQREPGDFEDCADAARGRQPMEVEREAVRDVHRRGHRPGGGEERPRGEPRLGVEVAPDERRLRGGVLGGVFDGVFGGVRAGGVRPAAEGGQPQRRAAEFAGGEEGVAGPRPGPRQRTDAGRHRADRGHMEGEPRAGGDVARRGRAPRVPRRAPRRRRRPRRRRPHPGAKRPARPASRPARRPWRRGR